MKGGNAVFADTTILAEMMLVTKIATLRTVKSSWLHSYSGYYAPGMEKAMATLLLYDTSSPESLRATLLAHPAIIGLSVTSVELNADHIRPCAGCFKCWVKTPGRCQLTRDGVNDLSRRYVSSDLVILLTQVTWGGYSTDTKAFIDRCIPHLSPFFSIRNNEMHHAPRYHHYPDWLVIGYRATIPEERSTFQQLVQRNAVNFFAARANALCLEDEKFDEESLARLNQIIRGRV